MSIQDKQQELDSLKKLQAEIRTQRESAEQTHSQIRSSGYTNWSHYDEVILNLADKRRQEESLSKRIADLQRAINTQSQSLNFGSKTQTPVYQKGSWWHLWGHPYGSVNQTVTVHSDRLGIAALIAAFLLGTAAILFMVWKLNQPIPVGQFTIQVPTPNQQTVTQECQTRSGDTFRIAEHVYTAVHVGPCASGANIPQGSAVYADSDLRLFGIQIAKVDTSDPNNRFVGFTDDAVSLASDTGFYYIPNVSLQVAQDWAILLEALGHSVGEVYILQQR